MTQLVSASISFDAWAALPESHDRIELIEGVLQVAPSATMEHGEIVARLIVLLRAGNPEPGGIWVTGENDVRSGNDGIRPDIVVARPADNPLPAEALLLAVEVESPSSLGNDRVMKPRSLARSGCPSYWRISRSPLTVHVYELVDGEYAETQTATGPDVVEVSRPWPLRFTAGELDPAVRP